MTKSNGLPCKKCGTNEWDKWGNCKKCHLARGRQWKKDNQKRQAEHNRRWHEANPEYSRQWQKANQSKKAEHGRRWEQANPEKKAAKNHRRRSKKAGNGGSYTAEEFNSLCDYYGNKCLRCGRDDIPLTVDHVKPLDKGGTNDIENLQPLCKPCNSSKGTKHIDYRPDAGPLRWLQAKLFG